jgi:hypothetical protein
MSHNQDTLTTMTTGTTGTTGTAKPSIKLRDGAQLAELRRIAGTLTAAEARPVPVWEVIARLIARWRESESAKVEGAYLDASPRR